jgi:transcriptional regulator with PAS, ATPase and Fis domain
MKILDPEEDVITIDQLRIRISTLALRKHNSNIFLAADEMGISHKTLRRWILDYNIPKEPTTTKKKS